MYTVRSYNVVDAILRQLGSEFVAASTVNWTNKQENLADVWIDFERGLDADFAIDYVGIKTYFKNNTPIAWVDYENKYGYKEVIC